MENLRTQKAIGLATLRYMGLDTPSYSVVQSVQDVAGFDRLPWPQTFARPCPLRPRHGFIDSRRVATVEELRALVAHVLSVEPEGEVLLMPYVNARRSAVMTRNQVTIGLGHDGATGGKPGAVVFPLSHVDIPRADGVAHGYVESVISINDEVKFTQLRDGPASPAPAVTWIPQDVTVQRVLVPTDDALAWELTCQNAQRGDFAHIPGGTMVCHAAVHCVLHGIPLSFMQNPPSIGDTFKANADESPRVYLDDVAHGALHGMASSPAVKPAMHAAVFAAHQGLALPQTAAGARALGAGFATLLRVASGCCLGELRHTKTGAKLIREKFLADSENGIGRDQIYRAAWSGYLDARKFLAAAAANFDNGKNWPSSSYGGKNWRNCTLATIELDKAVQELTTEANDAAFKKALAAAHNLINAVHNGGGLFTKVVHQSTLDQMAYGQTAAVAKGAYFAADALAALGGEWIMLPPEKFAPPVKAPKKKYVPGGASFASVPMSVKLQFRDIDGDRTRWQIVQSKKYFGKGFNFQETEFELPASLILGNLQNMKVVMRDSAASGSGVQYRLVARTYWKKLPAAVADWLRAQYQPASAKTDRGLESASDDDECNCGDPECEECNG